MKKIFILLLIVVASFGCGGNKNKELVCSNQDFQVRMRFDNDDILKEYQLEYNFDNRSSQYTAEQFQSMYQASNAHLEGFEISVSEADDEGWLNVIITLDASYVDTLRSFNTYGDRLYRANREQILDNSGEFFSGFSCQ